MSKVKNDAMEVLLGQSHPDMRWRAETPLQRLGEGHPRIMRAVADHITRRVDELGGEASAGQLLAIQKEGELLGLQAVIADELLTGGVTSKDGLAILLPLYIRLGSELRRYAELLGVVPLPQTAKQAVDVRDLWQAAMVKSPQDKQDAPETPATAEGLLPYPGTGEGTETPQGDSDADTDTDAEKKEI